MSLVAASRGSSVVAVCGLLVVEHGLWAQASGVVALGLWAQAQELWCLIALQHVGFSQTRD